MDRPEPTRAIIASACALLLCACAVADPMRIHYTCDEAAGGKLVDSGKTASHGALVKAVGETVLATFTPKKPDTWHPILADGVQIKNIKPGSEMLLTGGEVPIVLHRDQDYAVDYAGGRFKAAGGGRMEINVTATSEVTYTNPGPERVPGRTGRALQFDGADDYVDCGNPEDAKALSAVTIDLWFQLGKRSGTMPILVSRGSGLALFLDKGHLVFRHHGPIAKTGKSAPETRSGGKLSLADGKWHHVVASYERGTTSLTVDGKRVGETKDATGAVKAAGPLRLGGTVDPHFFGGMMDEIVIRLAE